MPKTAGSRMQVQIHMGDSKITWDPPIKFAEDTAKKLAHRPFENKADWIAECIRLHQPVIFQDNTEHQCIMAFHAANAFIGKIMDTDCELIGVWYNNDWTNKSHWVHRSIRNTQP